MGNLIKCFHLAIHLCWPLIAIVACFLCFVLALHKRQSESLKQAEESSFVWDANVVNVGIYRELASSIVCPSPVEIVHQKKSSVKTAAGAVHIF